MNTIKISGKVVKIEKIKNNDYDLKLVIAMPLQMKMYSEGTFKQCYSYLSFVLSILEKEQFKDLQEGNFVEIIGVIGGNCKEDGTMTKDLMIFPKTVMKGAIK